MDTRNDGPPQAKQVAITEPQFSTARCTLCMPSQVSKSPGLLLQLRDHAATVPQLGHDVFHVMPTRCLEARVDWIYCE
jgi:hypothetical protein